MPNPKPIKAPLAAASPTCPPNSSATFLFASNSLSPIFIYFLIAVSACDKSPLAIVSYIIFAISVSISSDALTSILFAMFFTMFFVPEPSDSLRTLNRPIESDSKIPSKVPAARPFQNACLLFIPLSSASFVACAAADRPSAIPPTLPPKAIDATESAIDIPVLYTKSNASQLPISQFTCSARVLLTVCEKVANLLFSTPLPAKKLPMYSAPAKVFAKTDAASDNTGAFSANFVTVSTYFSFARSFSLSTIESCHSYAASSPCV